MNVQHITRNISHASFDSKPIKVSENIGCRQKLELHEIATLKYPVVCNTAGSNDRSTEMIV